MSTFTDEVLDDLGRYRETEEAVQTAADLRCWARAWEEFCDTLYDLVWAQSNETMGALERAEIVLREQISIREGGSNG